jgi:deoxyribodipyrimidine photo-lyase
MEAYPATRDAGLARLRDFAVKAGEEYASRRNHVPGTVSGLSPYIRHRLVSEEEVAREVLARHSFAAAEKFLQEVCWRTYWKGWLEMRPEVWFRYLNNLQGLRSRMAVEPDFAESVQRAKEGKTGLDCFDDWSRELRETGYLHNHVRMWFASIWVHTFRLPWQLGADFFMRHLLDGDPASNTLSWRWVCGLQTQGKVYLATAENIERFTEGRYAPYGLLASEAPPIPADHPIPKPRHLEPRDLHSSGEKTVLIVTEEDLTPEHWPIPTTDIVGVILIDWDDSGADGTKMHSSLVSSFHSQALESTKVRLEASGYPAVALVKGSGEECRASMQSLLTTHLTAGKPIVTLMRPSVGTIRTRIETMVAHFVEEGISVRSLRRNWDDMLWPHATHGFFRFKEQIPSVLQRLG